VLYTLRAIPLGGYVEFADDDGKGTYAPDDPQLLRNKPLPSRALVISAGVLANLVFSLAVLFAQVGGAKARLAAPGHAPASCVRRPAPPAQVCCGPLLQLARQRRLCPLPNSAAGAAGSQLLLLCRGGRAVECVSTSSALLREPPGALRRRPTVAALRPAGGDGGQGGACL
jgi:hypothetical protein